MMEKIKNKPIRTIFLGSNWESLATLETLHQDERFEVVASITQPDKPVGRKKIMTATPVKEYSLKNDIPVFHTENSEDKYKEALELYNPELLVVKAYGEIIPEFFLEAPKYKAINIHFSLLPKYRGAVPIQAAIMNGDAVTGITIVQMVEKLDAGPILTSFDEVIDDKDTNITLRQRLVEKSALIIGDVLQQWCEGKITPEEQDLENGSFCWQKDISKENAMIDWENQSVIDIDRNIRAFLPWPIAWTMWNEKRVKIFNATIIDNMDSKIELTPGEFKTHQERLFIGTNDAAFLLQVLELQMEGSTRMTAGEFTRGQDL
jgi:methionyl-tRNA formyltransferase